MKTTTIITLIAILFSLNIQASEYNFNDEPPVHDIPFDTKEIFDSLMMNKAVETVTFEEESYVDDIPFNTTKISEQALYEKALAEEFDFEDESFINDMPDFPVQMAKEERNINPGLSELINSI